MTKVSIVVPVYNAQKTLKKCIESILYQKFKEIELLLINDGSTDKSLEVCRKYERLDNRIKIISKKNEGSIKTRMRGIHLSSSNYLMFVDADDWLEKNAVEILYTSCIKENLDIAVGNTYRVLGNGIIKRIINNEYFNKDQIYEGDNIKEKLVVAYLHGHPFPATLHGKIYKKQFLLNSGKFLERIKFLGDDLFYNLEIFLQVNRVKVINKPVYNYRIGGYTNKYMPYLFEDITNGYLIQKEVIESHFKDSLPHQYYGISLMLLNSFYTCLYNLFNGELMESRIREFIYAYVNNEQILEAIDNEGSISYFPKEFLVAIKNKNIDYLYDIGLKMYEQKNLRRKLGRIVKLLPI